MTNFKIYGYDGYRGFYKMFSMQAETVDEIVEYLTNHFKEDTEGWIQLRGSHIINGRRYQIKAGRKVIIEIEFYWNKEIGYKTNIVSM